MSQFCTIFASTIITLQYSIIMERIKRYALLLILCLVAAGSLQAKAREKRVYAFAIGTCFNDTLAYFSAISQIPGAVLDTKTKFLNYRSDYSSQFQDYLYLQTYASYTCSIFFSTKKESLEKKYIKLRKRYQKEYPNNVVEVPIGNFAFKSNDEMEY